MGNTTKPITVKGKSNPLDVFALTLAAAATKVFEGAMVFRAAGVGTVVPPSNAVGQRFAGVSDQTIDNSGGAVAVPIRVRRKGVWPFAQTGTTIDLTQVDARVYANDDMTVTLTANNNFVGIVENVDDEGVWVRIDSATSGGARTKQTQTVILPLRLADIAAGVFAVNVPFNFTLNSTLFRTFAPATTAAKAATLTPIIGAVPVTGGVMALTSANQNAINNTVAGTAITAGATGTANSILGVTASAVTAFIEGSGQVEFSVTNNDS